PRRYPVSVGALVPRLSAYLFCSAGLACVVAQDRFKDANDYLHLLVVPAHRERGVLVSDGHGLLAPSNVARLRLARVGLHRKSPSKCELQAFDARFGSYGSHAVISGLPLTVPSISRPSTTHQPNNSSITSFSDRAGHGLYKTGPVGFGGARLS